MKTKILSTSSLVENKPQVNDKYILIIDFEGLDGSFKHTNALVLNDILKDYFKKNIENNDLDIRLLSFPNYKSESSYLVRNYLSGKYMITNKAKENGVRDVNRTTNFFYEDMYDTLVSEVSENNLFYKPTILILDRYYYSMMYYKTKFYYDFYDQNYLQEIINIMDFKANMEFSLPRANCMIKLFNDNFISSFENRDKNIKLDIYENDKEYLKKVYKDFKEIDFKPFLEDNDYKTILEVNVTDSTQDTIIKKIEEGLNPVLTTFKRKLSAIKIKDRYWRENKNV